MVGLHIIIALQSEQEGKCSTLPMYTIDVHVPRLSSKTKASKAGRSSRSYPSERTSMMAESQLSKASDRTRHVQRVDERYEFDVYVIW